MRFSLEVKPETVLALVRVARAAQAFLDVPHHISGERDDAEGELWAALAALEQEGQA